MSASMLVYCVGVATRPGLFPIAKETASAAPTLCTEYGPNLLVLLLSWFDSDSEAQLIEFENSKSTAYWKIQITSPAFCI